MKILHIIGLVDPREGGPIEGTLRLIEVWERMGHAQEIASLDSPDDPWVSACSVKVHALGIRSPLYNRLRRCVPWLRYSYSPHFVPWLRAHADEYDAVIVSGLWNYVALGATRGLRPNGVPYFVFTHGQIDPWFRKAYPIKHSLKQISWWLAESRLLHSACAVLFTTEEERLLARNAFWPYRFRECVVGYGTADVPDQSEQQIAAFHGALPALEKRRFLLFLSRIHPKKGCDILIRAFARIASAYPDLDLVIAGPDQIGWRGELERIAREEDIAGRLHWPGMLTGDAKWGAYRAAAVFVLPSHSENFGIVVAEALACNLPVLITDKVNIWREIAAGGGGLVSRDEVDEFSRIVRQFLDMSKDERKEMATRARDVFVNHFDMDTVALKMLEIIRRLK